MLTFVLLVLAIVLFALGFTAALRWLLGPERLSKAVHAGIWFPLPQLERLGERLIRPGSERTGTDQLVGSVATVVGGFQTSEADGSLNGRVHLAGAEWRARLTSANCGRLLACSHVVVRGVDGLTLVVEPYQASEGLAG